MPSTVGIRVIKIGKVFICSSGSNLTVFKVRLCLDDLHIQYHQLHSQQSAPRSVLRDVLGDPVCLFGLPGSAELNLLLFLIFSETCDKNLNVLIKALFNIDLTPHSKIQRAICELIRGDKGTWNELLRYDTVSAGNLSEKFRLDIEKVCGESDFLNLLVYFKERNEVCSGPVRELLRIHSEFCEYKRRRSPLHDFVVGYSNLMRSIEAEEVPNVTYKTLPFYNELELINEYNSTKNEKKTFNKKLLKRNFATDAEKKIRDLIVRKLK